MEPQVIPLSAEPPADTDIDLDADDIVEGAEDLPDDMRARLTSGERTGE